MAHTFQVACEEHINDIVRIWHEGWTDGHAAIVPAKLTQMRTVKSFEKRVKDNLSLIRVMILDGLAVAFYLIKGDEIDQMFVDRRFRGKGIAQQLMNDAETQLIENNVKTAWLSCAVGNERAAAFYRKSDWQFIRAEPISVYVESGNFMLNIWRFEKQLS